MPSSLSACSIFRQSFRIKFYCLFSVSFNALNYAIMPLTEEIIKENFRNYFNAIFIIQIIYLSTVCSNQNFILVTYVYYTLHDSYSMVQKEEKYVVFT